MKIFNPFYRLLTRVVITATTTEELWDSWKHDYEPFGYVFIQEPTVANLILSNTTMFQMKICKSLI